MATVAFEEFVGGSGSPGSGVIVRKVARRQSAPDIEDGIHDPP